MFKTLKSIFGHTPLTEEGMLKEINNCIGMIFDRGDYFAKRYVGVEVFQKREDLMTGFMEYIKNKAKEIVASDNPHLTFREAIVSNTRVKATNDVLLRAEFDGTRDQICEAINRGMRWAEENGLFLEAIPFVRDAEKFWGQPWGYVKLVHESTWAEVESLVLRHLQIMIFETVNKKSDWWEIYRQAYENYMVDFYKIVIEHLDKPEGFPHPMIAAMGSNAVTDMENLILERK
jgi:SPX domain protein involved in polyphosphate accumulation